MKVHRRHKNNQNITSASNNIIISEVLYNEYGSNTEAEWIQLYNPSKKDIDLKGWSFVCTKRNSEEVHTITYGTISPGETLVFGKSDFLRQYGREPDQVMDFILTNKQMVLTLKDDQGSTVDTVGWGGTGEWKHLRAGDNQSLLRIDDATWIVNTNPDLTDVSYLTASRHRTLKDAHFLGGKHTVIITEVLYNEPGSNTDAEWIQLYNPTEKLVNLNGWDLVIWNNKIASQHPISGYIGPGETFMLGKKDFREYYGRIADCEFDFVLTNKRLVLGLKNPDNQVVDKVGWNMEEWKHLRARDNQSLLRMTKDKWIVNTNEYVGNVAYSMWSGPAKNMIQGKKVLFSEILYNSGTEWIQIYNPTSIPVDLSDWALVKTTMEKNDSEEWSPLTFLAAIEPGESLVFAKTKEGESADGDFYDAYGYYPDGTFSFDLMTNPNSSMILTLLDSSGEVVDEVEWDSASGWAHLTVANVGESIVRNGDKSWTVNTTPDPFRMQGGGGEKSIMNGTEEIDICC